MKSRLQWACARTARPQGLRALQAAAPWLAAWLLSACDATSPPPAQPAEPSAAFPWTAPWAQARPEEEPAAPMGPSVAATPAEPRWELEPLGDVERPDGRVERSYRVTLHNGRQAQAGLLATVSSTRAGVQVQQGLLALGDLAPGASGQAARSLTLLQPAHWVAQPADLQWALSGDAALHDSAGALLPGSAQQPALEGLRLWQPPLEAGWRVEVTLAPAARVGGVNQALQQHRLRIAQMQPGRHTLSLHALDEPGSPALRRIALALQHSGAFTQVRLLPPPANRTTDTAALVADTDPNACHQ